MNKKFAFCIFYFIFFTPVFSQVENRASLQYTYYATSDVNNINTINQSNVDFNYFLKSKKVLKKNQMG